MKTIIKIKLTILESEAGYTIFDSNNEGGAIISDKNKSTAIEKFKEASHLLCAVMSLLQFSVDTPNFYIAEFIE